MKKILIGLGIVLIIIGVYYIFWKGQKLDSARTFNPGGVDSHIRPDNLVLKKEIFKFAVMADIHNDTVSLNKALAQARGDKFVVVAGDVTINGTENEENKIKNSLDGGQIKYYIVPGNHDDYKDIWLFGKKYQSFKEGNFKLILIDNSSRRGLGEEQKMWIENEVKECLVIKCAAVMHMPLVNNFSKHIMGEDNQTAAGQVVWLKDKLLANGVKTGYSGHLHYSSDYVIDGWETVLVGAVSTERNTETPRFTEVTVYDDGSIENQVRLIIN